ncbi:hypothetical protein ACOBQX_13590 [Actinokineospora sp. G85]|uniref:hypothetical protein n=1 Tax=Actinokineospora sp. G85 TaxID=3406626 RepID=UPI003C760FA7
MGLIALIVVIVAAIAVVGNVGYLALLGSAADKKGASGSAVSRDVKAQWPVAGAAAAGTLVAWLFSAGGPFLDVLAIIIGGVSAVLASNSLSKVRRRYGSQN